MHLSPDQVIFWQYGFVKLNATIAWTWALMLLGFASLGYVGYRRAREPRGA